MSQCPGEWGVLPLCFPKGSGGQLSGVQNKGHGLVPWHPTRGPRRLPHLVNVHSCDGPRVALQGEEATRVLQTEHLGQGWASVLVWGGFPAPFWPGNPFCASSPRSPTRARPPQPPQTEPTLTLSVWSWLPVTSRPAAAFRAVMGFWCAQGTVWVRRQATVSLLLYTGDVGELLRPGVPGDKPSMRSLRAAAAPPAPAGCKHLPSAGPLTSELQGAEGSAGLQGEEIQGAVEPGSHNPGREEWLLVALPQNTRAGGRALWPPDGSAPLGRWEQTKGPRPRGKHRCWETC